ncbi:glycosyltransferase [Candidatus Daviesbacteria bacterium]|nr:glycosyltransferase [Candidatus Daviesbacteria bacterium]
MAKKIVIVLPTYNERNSLKKFIDEVFEQGRNLPGYNIEILISDSKSPDGTGELAESLSRKDPRIHVIKVGRGLGVGLIEGHNYSLKKLKPDIMVQLDADGQVQADVLPRLINTLGEGYDFVFGSRFVKGGKNKLSFQRRLFSAGASLICRLIMGPFSIKEFTNSARAFTPALFKKINLERLPWREQTFIVQPAFLNEAILAGAKYKEVPLVFRNRHEGYSKNKVVNYTYDVITYSLDARLHKWGIDFPLFYYSRRAKTIIKFAIVGFIGVAVDFIFYNFFISFLGFRPATAKGFSTEIAILNNFSFNNIWTFRHRKTKSTFWQKLGIFNLVSLGGLAISVLIIKFLHVVYGDGFVLFLGIKIAFYNLYFFATLPPVLIWNFTVNHFITWKHEQN